MGIEIRRYEDKIDQDKLIKLIENEGEEWSCYWSEDFLPKYREALCNSITYVAYRGDELCGFLRSLDDCGFYIYICDLLVSQVNRGEHIGRKLMESICRDYPKRTVYVMSDVDEYYEKLGFKREGSVYEVGI